MPDAIQEGRAVDNGVHCSDSVENGIRECSIFFWDYVHDETKVGGMATEEGTWGRDLAKLGYGVFFEERLENRLRDLDIVHENESFEKYNEIPLQRTYCSYGWDKDKEDTITAAGRISVGGENRDVVSIAFIPFPKKPENALNEWLNTRKQATNIGLNVPKLYASGRATSYEQYLPFTAKEALKMADEGTEEKLLRQIGHIYRTLDDNFSSVSHSLDNLRSDGEDMYISSFGSNLRGYKEGRSRNTEWIEGEFSGSNKEIVLESYEERR